jgi:peptidoglycan/LPS O-acetylase OafA/YrhL
MVLILAGKLMLTDFHFDWVQVCVVLLHLVMLHNFIPGVGGAIDGTYWTMGVEFPYYFAMLALAPFLRMPRCFAAVSGGMIAAALLWRSAVHVFLRTGPDPSLMWFADSQIVGFLDLFALGGLAAHLRRPVSGASAPFKHPGIALLASFAALAVLLGYYARHTGDYWAHWQTSALFKSALAANFALIVFLLTDLKPGRAIRWSTLPWFGRISFSFYLYHFPCIALVQGALPDMAWPVKPIAISTLTTGVSWLSWRFVEIRFHRFVPQTNAPNLPVALEPPALSAVHE